jgi:hypothetical protein
MGISRSTTVVIAYLVATTRMTPREALATIQSKRAIVRPNAGFMAQLDTYHSTHSHSLQAKLVEPQEKEQVPSSLSLKVEPDAMDEKWGTDSEGLNARRWRQHSAASASCGTSISGAPLSVKDAGANLKSYVCSALAAVTPVTAFPSFIPQQREARECWKFESSIC